MSGARGLDLTRLRERLGLSMHAMAELMGLSTAYISRLENGWRRLTPNVEKRAAIVRTHLIAMRREIEALP
jgi:transcriptional regulator with XRE-family HTH domain